MKQTVFGFRLFLLAIQVKDVLIVEKSIRSQEKEKSMSASLVDILWMQIQMLPSTY